MTDSSPALGFATRVVHAGQSPDPSTGAVVTPIYANSTYIQESPGVNKGLDYGRSHNPTRWAFERCIADLEGGVREPTYSNITSNGQSISFRIPQSMTALLREREAKFQEIIRQGRTGTVTFSNIDLPGEAGEPAEVE